MGYAVGGTPARAGGEEEVILTASEFPDGCPYVFYDRSVDEYDVLTTEKDVIVDFVKTICSYSS